MRMHRLRTPALVFSFLIITHLGFGQVEGTMAFMKGLPQVTYYNPAFKPEYKFSFGLPGSSIFYQYSNNGFNYNDFVSRQDGKPVANMSDLYAKLKDKNYINNNFQADLFRISVKANARLYLTLNSTAKVYTRIMLPKEFVGVFANGTEAYVNKTAALSPEVEGLSYIETGLGAAYTVNRKLTVGAKVKLLNGGVNVTTKKALFNLSLSAEDVITTNGDADIRTSGVHGLGKVDIEDDWSDYTKNTGFAFDVGATYRVKDRLTLGLSLVDFGGITWQNDLYGYQLDPATASYTFGGIDANKLLDGDSDYSGELSKDIETKFKFTEGRIGSYSTPLPTKVYATGVYELRKTFTLGMLLSVESFMGRYMTGATASVNKEFGRRLGASLSYTATNNSFNNIGAGLSLNFAPIQIYFVGDNLLGAPISYLTNQTVNSFINNTQYFNFRTGINFVFGRQKAQEKYPDPKTRKSK